ncbi:hypothetical protein JVT61DRAFT_8532 [Boletus reticuloceps]|uniref:Uncharacterized protein n=1 Tax=Boletus reticuloceps TaxID=495285 RepID=A0A8I2YVV8_9AGAM|nr:hypothetical protein JVT61DRAFT_8532 [Boletus reticuloceps]
MTLYQHGILNVSPIDGFHAFDCPHCLSLVKSSISVTVSLSIISHFTVLSNHYRRKSCITQHTHNESHSAQIALKRLNSIPSTPTSSSSPLSNSSHSELFTPPPISSNSANDSHSNLSNTILPCNPVYGPAPPLPCHGLPFHWEITHDANMQVTLPWLRTLHGKQDELPYTLNILDDQAYARSPNCTHFVEDTGDSCALCASLRPAVDDLGKTIQHYQPHTRRSLKNVHQLSQTIDDRAKELEHWKLKSLNDGRSISNKLNTISNHSVLLMAMSQMDVPWLQCLLQAQIKNGVGVNTIICCVEEAIEQGYKPCGYSDDAYDLVLLIYRIGGANLLYALNQ